MRLLPPAKAWPRVAPQFRPRSKWCPHIPDMMRVEAVGLSVVEAMVTASGLGAAELGLWNCDGTAQGLLTACRKRLKQFQFQKVKTADRYAAPTWSRLLVPIPSMLMTLHPIPGGHHWCALNLATCTLHIGPGHDPVMFDPTNPVLPIAPPVKAYRILARQK